MIYIEESQSYVYLHIARIISYELNLPVQITDDFSKKGTWILFATGFMHNVHKIIDGSYIVVQTENYKLSNNPRLQTDEYLEFLNNALFVWDYTSNFKLGYSLLNEIEFEESKPIDILFYGSLNDRRINLLSKIDNCKILDPVDSNSWFPNLWNSIRNSKIVLSIHYYNPSNNDMARLAPLLSNSVFTISERCNDENFNNIEDMIIADYDDIPNLCKYYLKHPEKRIEMKKRGYEYIIKNPIIIPSDLSNYV